MNKPTSFAKHQANPKVVTVIAKIEKIKILDHKIIVKMLYYNKIKDTITIMFYFILLNL